MPKSTTVNKNGFTPFANDGCESLLYSQWEYIGTYAKSTSWMNAVLKMFEY